MLVKWLPLIIALLLNAAANIMMKVGSRTAPQLDETAGLASKVAAFLNPATIVAIALFGANVLFYRKALDGLNVSVAYPIMVSTGLVIITIAAAVLPVLHERITPLQVLGMALIAAGVWLVAAFSPAGA